MENVRIINSPMIAAALERGLILYLIENDYEEMVLKLIQGAKEED
jgi:hypothetical protein